MSLVLITGAGASCRLGEADDPLPLMPDWSDALCSALDEAEKGLARACHLTREMTGVQFEEFLGLLLRYQQVHPLEERFEGLGGPSAGSVLEPVRQARAHIKGRLDLIIKVINRTLYEQFGQSRVDDDRAAAAYASLFEHFDASDLVVATTNYDRACEAALSRLGREPDTGFRSENSESVPTLQVTGLVESAMKSDATACLHLHGAVGWYQKDGTDYDFRSGHEYNETLGTPVVLYPDPLKDPTSDAHVASLWDEFRFALDYADYVLVLGHSLHDPALVNAIREANPGKLAVTYFADEEAKRIKEELPSAIPMKMDFGPELDVDRAAVAAFRG
jgi:hypothetical protein